MLKEHINLIEKTMGFDADLIRMIQSHVRTSTVYADGTKEYTAHYHNDLYECFGIANTKWQCVLSFCKRLKEINDPAFTSELVAAWDKSKTTSR